MITVERNGSDLIVTVNQFSLDFVVDANRDRDGPECWLFVYLEEGDQGFTNLWVSEGMDLEESRDLTDEIYNDVDRWMAAHLDIEAALMERIL